MSIKGDVLPGGINQEIQGVTTQTRAHPDDFNPNVLKPLLDNDVTLSRQLETLPSKPINFNPGYQIVESEYDAPFRLGEIKGRTLVNLLGRAGGMESAANILPYRTTLATNTENADTGTKSLKVTVDEGYDSGAGFYSNFTFVAGKYYVAIAMIQSLDTQKARLSIPAYGTGNIVTTTDKFAPSVIRVGSLDSDVVSNVDLWVEGAGKSAYFDSVRIYEITDAEFEAIATMTPEQVAERYPYVDSITNVKDPYAIVTGGNLLPPFYEWTIPISQMKILSSYSAQIIADADDNVFATDGIKVLSETQYTLSAQHDGNIGIAFLDEDNNVIYGSGYTTNQTLTVTTPPKTEYLRVYFSNLKLGIKTYTIENPILTVGTEPQPFTPQKRSMLAFETELAAHPVEGSNPDTLFMGDDGLPYMLEKWGKVVLDGSFVWERHSTQNDFKIVFANDCVPNNSAPGDEDDYGRLFVTKYNGSLLTVNDKPINTENWKSSDYTRIFKSNAYISVHNNESGWGGNYNPTADEIKAYFLGWKMFDGQAHGDGTGVYNRTDGLYKAWTPLDSYNGNFYHGVYNGPGVPNEIPSIKNTDVYVKHRAWTPYRLQYLKAKPTVEPVRDYELGATLTAGSNMVEVGSGIVIRERANSYVNYINAINAPGGRLKYRTTRLLSIYRNQARDFGWIFKDNIWNGEPYQYAENPSPALPEAVYHVTYTMLEPTLAAPISGTVAANLRGTVTDLVQDVGDIGLRLSVVENQKAEKDAPGWITPTLLNGWLRWGERWSPPQYYKDDNGIVHLRGLVKGGVIDGGKAMFVFPQGYRPSHSSAYVSYSQGAGVAEVNGVIARIDISGETGSVYATRGSNELFSLEGISFRAER